MSANAGRPNILWICADDYAVSACGAYGNPVVRTPNIDELARQGLRFDRAFCPCPLSTPSRQAFWTGRYPRSIGVTLSPSPLPDDEVTLPTLLRRSGYKTTAFGKTHYYAARKHEFDVCADHEEFALVEARLPKPAIPEGVCVLGLWRPFRDPAVVWLNSMAWPVPAYSQDMQDTWLCDKAVSFLGQRHDRPFFLYVSLFAMHSPFRFPIDWAGRHCPEEFAVPAVPPHLAEDIPEVFRSLTEGQKRGIVAAYHTAAEFQDWNVGRVLKALESSPHARDTVVLFTSDHGYLLGQRGRFEKHCCYEPAIQTILLLKAPGLTRPGTSTEALVELIDLVPTLLEVARVEVGNLHGRSLLPLLRGERARHRDHVFIEYADNAEGAVRTGRWKLIYGAGTRRRRDGYMRPEGPKRSLELYDLEADPEELSNRAADPGCAAVVSELLGLLVEHVRATARVPEMVPERGSAEEVLATGLLPAETFRGW